MSKIDYQALREAAQNAKDLGGIKNYKRGDQAVAEFESMTTPHIVLTLLDEIKHMQDQAIDDGCRIAELEEAFRDKQALIPDECDTTAQQFESLSNHKNHFINGTCVECLKSE